MPQTKNQIAQEFFEEDFRDLTEDEKEEVREEYSEQREDSSSSTAGVKATIGRLGVNGTKTCLLNTESTVQDLLDQSNYGFDSDKEKILDQDSGNAVDLEDAVKHNGTYAIAVEVRSA